MRSGDRPNILLLTTDQQRWDTLGCYGATGVHTPNLDRLASEGTRFDRCYVSNPVCTPSRAGLWTGKHLPCHGVYRVHDRLADDEILFAHRLTETGYDTALIGKLHVSGHMHEAKGRHPHDGFRVYEWTPDPHGYTGVETAYLDWLDDRFAEIRAQFRERGRHIGHLPIEAHMTTWAAERTVAYLTRERRTDRPFFCCMSVFDPHDPYGNYPERMRCLLDESKLPGVVAGDEPFDRRPAPHLHEREKCALTDMRTLTPERLHEWRVGYHAAIALIDMQIGRVLDALTRAGLAENTLVIFASDHGDILGDHGLLTKGCFFYDPCTRVPLILREPGGRPGRAVSALCQPNDIAATVLRAAGFSNEQVGAWMPDSRDLRDEQALAERGYAACLYRNTGIGVERDSGRRGYFDPPLHGTMWREGRYKLNVYHSPPPTGDHAPGELFDMQTDALEMHNLWTDPAHCKMRDALLLKMTNWLAVQDARARAQSNDGVPASPRYQGRTQGE